MYRPVTTEPAIAPLSVGDVMTRDVLAVAPDTSVVTAARLFSQRHISGAPVIDASGRAVGVVTQTDLVDPDRARTHRLGKSMFYRITDHTHTLHGDDPVSPEGLVTDVMSPFVLSTAPSVSLADAIRRMVADDVHRLLVIDDGKLCGILTSMDVMRAVVGENATAR